MTPTAPFSADRDGDPSPPPLPARYRVTGRLGAGGMGEVWAAVDDDRAEDVAIKVARPEAGPAAALALHHEFWAMQALPHPRLITAHEAGTLPDGTPFLVMERVAGPTLAAAGVQHEAAVRAWLPDVVGALATLHAHGYRHGDVKPENVIFDRAGAAKLLDLGLLARVGQPGGEIRGSLPYLAPELIRQGAPDGRADWYALGAVVYEAMVGKPPFPDVGGIALLRAHLDRPAPRLRASRPDVSAALDELVAALLAKDPRHRPGAADVYEALGLAPDPVASANLLGSPLVGRDAELAAIAQAGTTAHQADAQAGALWFTGASGAGKSRLLQAAIADARLAGRPVAWTAGRGEEAGPYAALASWLQEMTAAAPEAFARLGPFLARLLPQPGVTPAPVLEGPQERVRLHGALVELALAAWPEARLLAIDDADRLEPASLELVGALARAGTARGWGLVFAGESGPPPALAAVVAVRPLGNLSPEDARALAAHKLGVASLPAALARAELFAEGALPGDVEASLAAWLERGELTRAGRTWAVAPGAPLAPAFAGLASAHAALGGDALAIVQAAAELGPSGSLAWLLAACGLEPAAFFAALAEVGEDGTLAVADQRYRFGRPATIGAIAAGTPPALALAARDRGAAWLIAQHGDDPGAWPLEPLLDVARLVLLGSTPAEGVRWALLGAQRALQLFAIERADQLLTLALAATTGMAGAERRRLATLSAFARRYRGDVAGAQALYEGWLLADLRAAGDGDLASHLVSYGILHQLAGRYPEAAAAFAEAAALADAAGDLVQAARARVYAGRTSLFAGASQDARATLAEAIRIARQADGDPQVVAQCRSWLAWALGLLGYMLATAGAEAEGLAMLDEAVALNDALGDRAATMEVLNNRGNYMLAVGRYQEAREVFVRFHAYCTATGCDVEAIFAQVNLACALFELGELDEASPAAHAAADHAAAQGQPFPQAYATALAGLIDVYRGRIGPGLAGIDSGLAQADAIKNRYVALYGQAYRAEALFHLGRWSEAADALALAQRIARESGNDELAGKLAWLDALLGIVAPAPTENEAARGDARAPERLTLAELATQAAGAGLTSRAALLGCWRAWELARAENWDACEATAREARDGACRSGLLRVAAEAARLAAAAALAQGAAARATAHAEAGLEAAQRSGDPLLGWLLEAARPDLAPGRRRALALAQAELIAALAPEQQAAWLRFPERTALARPTPGPADGVALHHVARLAELSAAIARAADLPEVMRRALEAIMALAQAERGFVVLYEGFAVTDQIFIGLDPDAEDGFSTSIAERVLWSGEPLFLEDALADGALAGQASVVALGLRRVMAVPLLDGDEVLGVMLADSRSLGTPWDPADMQAATALGQAVAIAIGAARGREAAAARGRELEMLARLLLATAGVGDPHAFAQAALAEALALTGAERAALMLDDTSAGLRCLAARTSAAGSLSVAEVAVSTSACRWVLDEREALFMVDLEAGNVAPGQSALALGLQTIYAVPVHGAERTLGVLYLDSPRLGEAPPSTMSGLGALAEALSACLARASSLA